MLGSCAHIALWRELMPAARCIDHHLLEEMLHGFPIVDKITRSYRWPLLAEPDTAMSLDELHGRAWEFHEKVLRNVRNSEVTDNTQKIWDATMEDVEEGVTLGPFFSRDDVSKIVGADIGGSLRRGSKWSRRTRSEEWTVPRSMASTWQQRSGRSLNSHQLTPMWQRSGGSDRANPEIVRSLGGSLMREKPTGRSRSDRIRGDGVRSQ